LDTMDYESRGIRDNGGAKNEIQRKRGRRKNKDGDLQLIFPEVQRLTEKPSDEKVTSTTNGDENETNMSSRHHDRGQYTTKSVRSASCILNLEKNGRFTLSLVDDEYHNQSEMLRDRDCELPSDTDTDTVTASFTKTQPSSSPIHQPLQGDWYLTPNPYCITDRHYDTLLLVSEPRMRRLRSSMMIEKATVEMRCKMWGRYGAGAVRKKIGLKHGRVRGRMTHGTVMIVKEEVDGVVKNKKKVPTREVVGTFRGKANVDFDPVGRDANFGGKMPFGDDDDEDDDLNFEDNFDEFGDIELRSINDE